MTAARKKTKAREKKNAWSGTLKRMEYMRLPNKRKEERDFSAFQKNDCKSQFTRHYTSVVRVLARFHKFYPRLSEFLEKLKFYPFRRTCVRSIKRREWINTQ